MKNKRDKSLNYYFLNRILHPKPYPGYKQSIIGLIINKNSNENKDKILFIQEKTGYWFLPKGSIKGENLADTFFESVTLLLEKELGLRGMGVHKKKPKFTQISYIFDFERQKYNPGRAKQEKEKGNPAKGKLYHLSVMYYEGEDDLDLKSNENAEVLDYKWVKQTEAEEIVEKNSQLIEDNPGYSESYQDFQKRLLSKILSAYETIEAIKAEKGVFQKKLL